METVKKIAIFGSTGSIGTQTLQIIKKHSDKFKASVLVAKNNVELLIAQAIEFKPIAVAIENANHYVYLENKLNKYGIKVYKSKEGILDLAKNFNYDFMVAAIVGFSGLYSVIEAVKSKKNIGLANKESIVVAGNILMSMARTIGVSILPIDSEHSAIFQCLQGECPTAISEIIITASGGPFRGRKPNFLTNVKKEHALRHPVWRMGSKISIDSATLMNKGLEIIEAHWLFGLNEDKIKVLVHPEALIHGIVKFIDGSYKVQMSQPDMQLAIQYALSYPIRFECNVAEINFLINNKLTLENPDTKTFKCLELARIALREGGNKPCILNAANEELVYAFLKDKIGFLDIAMLAETVLHHFPIQQYTQIEDYQEIDRVTREFTRKAIEMQNKKFY